MSSNQTEGVILSVEPLSCLHDEPVHIKVTGLKAHQDVTLQTSMKDVRNVHFMSHAHYRANADGEVDVDVMESLGGRYEGVFPMGLFGSLQPSPNEYKYTRFFKRDVENPNLVTVSVHDGHVSAETLCSSDVDIPLNYVIHERHYMAPGVQRIPVRYGKVRGCLFLPPGDGPFPGIVDMFGTAGGLLEFRSAQLASRGFASLALAFFNYDDLPKNLEEFDIAYFEEAVEYLLKHEKVHDYGVGVVGTSKGGDLAASMAAFIPSVLACVTINGFFAPSAKGMRVGDRFYRPFEYYHSRKKILNGGVMNALYCMPDRKALEKLMLPLEKSRSAFLFLVGVDDQSINSGFQAWLACQYLSAHGYEHEYHVESYPGTGHLIEPPYSPHYDASFLHTAMCPIHWGGSMKYHTLAQDKAWKRMIEFLWCHLGERESSGKYNPTIPLRSCL